MIGREVIFRAAWKEFSEALSDREQYDFYKAIIEYGVYNKEPCNLSRDVRAYFESNVRPMIDRQLKKQ